MCLLESLPFWLQLGSRAGVYRQAQNANVSVLSEGQSFKRFNILFERVLTVPYSDY